jgi:hypothetical protein
MEHRLKKGKKSSYKTKTKKKIHRILPTVRIGLDLSDAELLETA